MLRPRSAWALLAWGAVLCGARAQSPGFLLISAPRNAKISWLKLPENGSFEHVQPQTLIDTGLVHPQGIAIDQKRKRLLVTDPDVKKIYSYQLHVDGDSLVVEDKQTVVSTAIESRSVAVDGNGNIFFSDEADNQIFKVAASVDGAEAFLGGALPRAEVLYGGNMLPQVAAPGGVAVDNFHVYWTNKHFGMQTGSVVKASEAPEILGSVSSVNVLAQNAPKCYGVCLALGNVFFTDADNKIYGVKKAGGYPALVTSMLSRPRGCSWDGDGTVYVADRGLGGVYSFAGTMQKIGSTRISKAFDFEDAYGVAFLASGDGRRCCRASGALLATAVASLASLLS